MKRILFGMLAVMQTAWCIPNETQAAEQGEPGKNAPFRTESDESQLKEHQLIEELKKQYQSQVSQVEKSVSMTPQEAESLRKTILALEQRSREMQQQLTERNAQLAQLSQYTEEQDRRRDLPPLEGAQVKVYPLTFVKAREAAKTIESLFGTQAMRLAVDEQSNALVVYGKADALAALDTLLSRLDQQAASKVEGDSSKKTTKTTSAEPRTLVLRLFWIADGLPADEGQNPFDFLPDSVLAALNNLGLRDPRLVTQTVNSLAIGGETPSGFVMNSMPIPGADPQLQLRSAGDAAVGFSTTVPAVLAEKQAILNTQGSLRLIPKDRVAMEVNLGVQGAANCELHGSLVMPLGHYMVLGTANSVIGEPANLARPGNWYGPQAGMRPVRGGPVGAGPGVGPAGGLGGVAEVGGPDPQPAEPNVSTSRFAFVVQVVEAQSYTADAAKGKNAKALNGSEENPFTK